MSLQIFIVTYLQSSSDSVTDKNRLMLFTSAFDELVILGCNMLICHPAMEAIKSGASCSCLNAPFSPFWNGKLKLITYASNFCIGGSWPGNNRYLLSLESSCLHMSSWGVKKSRLEKCMLVEQSLVLHFFNPLREPELGNLCTGFCEHRS